MRLVVTGATSLLGAHVVDQLVSRGDGVTTYQRRPSANGIAGRCRDVLGDVRDHERLRATVAGHDGVIHLAALVGPRLRWQDAYAVNVAAVTRLSDAQRAGDFDRLVHISSPSVAFTGHAAVGQGAEAACYRGTDMYATTKAIGEQYVGGARQVIVRPHLVWGPGDTQLVGRLVDRARAGRLVLPDGGRALIDTTYVTDAAAAIVAAFDHAADPYVSAQPWVVTGNDPRPVGELVTGIVAACGVHGGIRSVPASWARLAGRLVDRWWPGTEPPFTAFSVQQMSVAHWFDQRATQRALRWAPRVTVDEGLRRLAESVAGQ